MKISYFYYKSFISILNLILIVNSQLFSDQQCAFHKRKLQSLMFLVIVEFTFFEIYIIGGKPVFSTHHITV